LKILVCGGAGYIGSHMVKTLLATSHETVVLDDLSTGHAWAVPENIPILNLSLLDAAAIRQALEGANFDAVIHFAARSLVGESVTDPALYYAGNVTGTLNLLDAMRHAAIPNIVFSSTAAVFGMPEQDFIDESHPLAPINPYGRSKLMIEGILADYARAYALNAVCLRYFNAAGATPDGSIGEAHDPETHLIPNILLSLLPKVAESGKRPIASLRVFGNDYATADGTCVRDYIHVNDLAQAHLVALDHLLSNPGFHAFNLGNGQGFSVMEVIRACEQVTGRTIDFTVEARRPGDPPRLVADSRLAREVLGWAPEFTSLEAIIETAWRWHYLNKGI
jgi:UDP-glucose 4-epimerase